MERLFPVCLKCKEGVLLPLSDFGGQGAMIPIKAWVCSSPRCDFCIKVKSGDIQKDIELMRKVE